MEIKVVVIIDGETINLNDDLQKVTNDIISHYIKNKLGEGFIKKSGWGGARVKNLDVRKRPYRPKISPEEWQKILSRAQALQHLTLSQAVKILKEEYGVIPVKIV